MYLQAGNWWLRDGGLAEGGRARIMSELEGVACFALHVLQLHLRNDNVHTDELKNAYDKDVQ